MRTSRLLAFLISSGCGAALAEPPSVFSRANCFNNESITYNFFEPAQWRGVVSHHIDHDNGNTVHYVGHQNPSSCIFGSVCPSTCYPVTVCLWPITLQQRHAAIHNSEDGWPIPWLSSRWHTDGVHVFSIPAYYIPVSVVVNTSADDCNLHFNQFY